MKHSREFLVGITIIAAIILFALGIRYFQDLPFFGGGYMLETSFANAGGLVSGSPVRINGVSAGTVRNVALRTDRDDVHVEFEMHGDVSLPEGSWVTVSGVEMLGNVQLEVVLGPASAPPIEPGSVVPARVEPGVGEMMDRAPAIIARTDTLLLTSQEMLDQLRRVVAEQSVALEETMISMRSAAGRFNRILAANEEAIGVLLANTSTLSGELNAFAADHSDSLSLAVTQFNGVLRVLNMRLEELDQTITGVDSLVAGVRRGDGTLGLLANDPAVYHRLDSVLTNLNQLLVSLERNPERFMRELRLIDLF